MKGFPFAVTKTERRRMACDTFYSMQNTRYMLNSLTFGFWQREIYA